MSATVDIEYELINCPFCGVDDSRPWAAEAGWAVVKCGKCQFLYCNPRPSQKLRQQSTQLGVHSGASELDISERRIPNKVNVYRSIFRRTYADVWELGEPISWIDIGAGYGEVVEAVQSIAPRGSAVYGLEPMRPKVEAANRVGLKLIHGYIDASTPVCDFASVINIFSHIYDFDLFLQEIRGVLAVGGNLFLETGDMAGVLMREQLPGELGLPDHVAFASKKHLVAFLERNGFCVISIDYVRTDTWLFFLKTIVKRSLGRDVKIRYPYSSPYRSIRIRAVKQ